MTIGGVTLKNRIIAAPMPTERFTDGNGMPTAACLQEYEARARGGAGVVTVAEPPMALRLAVPCPDDLTQGGHDTGICRQESLLRLADRIKNHGAVAAVQLELPYIQGLAASALTLEALTAPDMKAVAQAYGQAAAVARAAGFQMFLLPGGIDSLLGRCLSPDANLRTDKFGGSLENRARLPLMVIRAVRQALGPESLLAYQLTAPDADGAAADTVAFCQLLQGQVDLLLVTAPTLSTPYQDSQSPLSLAQAIKAATELPVAAAGGFHHPQQVEQALAAGQCDLALMGRQLLADPDFVRKTEAGRVQEIAPCLGCSCLQALGPDPAARPWAEPFQCGVNPYALRRDQLQTAPAVQRSQKILVVGGGPAGMYAAITAAQRGHTVRLAERSDRLGGQLWFADSDTYKKDLAAFRDCLAARCKAAGVSVVYNTAVNEAYIARYAPDCVLLAIGAAPKKPPIPGLAVFAHHVLWAYAKPETVGERVIIVGGGLAGVECALYLAALGRQVTVLGRNSQLAPMAYPSQRQAIEQHMPEGMTVKTAVTVTEVRPGGVCYRARNGRSVELEGDTVLYALGTEPRPAQALRQAHPNTHLIGDCRVPGRVQDAVRDGLFAAWDIV
jgi:2,4-dienoyl-CoA reductase-like NADH-dependent reductase (Old Yellow Enzyme family)/thioredoxin reductase